LTGGELDGAKVDAAVAFPDRLKPLRATWLVGTTQIDDREVIVAQGSGGGQQPVKLYFNKDSGFLMRLVRYVQLPVGRVPIQIDYDDYRPVAGIKMPFTIVATWVDGRSTTKLADVQPNVPIDAARFAKPSAEKK
jgi:hypothetical protein